jgi:hypothetical protein
VLQPAFLFPLPFLSAAALRNLFENTAAVQFNHRMLAYTTLAGVATLWRYGSQLTALPPAARLCLHALAAATVGQVGGSERCRNNGGKRDVHCFSQPSSVAVWMLLIQRPAPFCTLAVPACLLLLPRLMHRAAEQVAVLRLLCCAAPCRSPWESPPC